MANGGDSFDNPHDADAYDDAYDDYDDAHCATMITTMMAMTTNSFGIMENISSIAMVVCFGRGLVPSIAAVMESALLAVAARVGILAAIRSWRRRL